MEEMTANKIIISHQNRCFYSDDVGRMTLVCKLGGIMQFF